MSGATNQRNEQVLQVIQSWYRPAELAEFAVLRHGFGNSDGGFGVTYADDLDEFAREIERHLIPSGCVEVYGHWGAAKGGFVFVIGEHEYLTILAKALRDKGLAVEAAKVERLQQQT